MSCADVVLGFDFDAVSSWIHSWGYADSPAKHARGVFGATVGAPRVLDVLDAADVTATWFVPGHTIESFPEICGEVHDRGHDVQHHGWKHVHPAVYDDAEDERADIERGIEAIRDLTGRTPTGYRSPAWDFSEHTLDIIRDLGFEWDSSFMGHDFRPYYLRDGWRAEPDEPYHPGEETNILELPVSWFRDDWPALQFVRGAESFSHGATLNESQVFGRWREQFDWMCDHVEDGVFILTLHPQVVGQAPRPKYLKEFVEYVRDSSCATFRTFDEVASEHQ